MPGSAAAGVLRCYRQNDAERGADEALKGDCGTEAEGRVVDESKHERAGGEDAGAHEAAHEAEAAIAKVDALTAGGEEGEGASLGEAPKCQGPSAKGQEGQGPKC